MAHSVSTGATPAESSPPSLLPAIEVARQTSARHAPNGIHFGSFGEISATPNDPQANVDRIVQAVPDIIAAALTRKTYYFVPLALAEGHRAEPANSAPAGHRTSRDETMIAPAYTAELADLAICHRNVDLPASGDSAAAEGVFISTRLLSDRFSLAFEFFINVGHAFVDIAGVPTPFAELAWDQALADTRGETSQDAWESRALALTGSETASSPTAFRTPGRPDRASGSAPSSRRVDEKAKLDFLESTFSDAIAIYLLSLAVDFDYSELREREYPLLAPHALAARVRLIAKLFPPNPDYEFSIRYRRRA